MGGGIEAESAPGLGSTFWFTVRLEKQAALFDSAAGQLRQEAELIAGLRDIRVLVVDDNQTSLHLLSARLAAWGMKPATADSGGAALARLREQALAGTPFELALLDLNLGSMDGVYPGLGHSQPADALPDASRPHDRARAGERPGGGSPGGHHGVGEQAAQARPGLASPGQSHGRGGTHHRHQAQQPVASPAGAHPAHHQHAGRAVAQRRPPHPAGR